MSLKEDEIEPATPPCKQHRKGQTGTQALSPGQVQRAEETPHFLQPCTPRSRVRLNAWLYRMPPGPRPAPQVCSRGIQGRRETPATAHADTHPPGLGRRRHRLTPQQPRRKGMEGRGLRNGQFDEPAAISSSGPAGPG